MPRAGGAPLGRVWKGSVSGSHWLLLSCDLLRFKEPHRQSTRLYAPPTSRFRALISVPGRMSQGSPPTHKRSTQSCPSSSTWAETLERGSPSGEPGACGAQDAHTGGETEAGG